MDKTLTERELKEVQHALYYAKYLNHGTAGHNQLMLLAQFATRLGFSLAGDNKTMIIPSGWMVISDSPEQA